MDVNQNVILILAFLGLAQALLLSVYLLRLKKGNRKSSLFLAFTILGITIRIAKSVLNYYLPLEAWQRNIGIAGIFIAGPCLWFYGITLLEKDKPFPKRSYLHLIPFALFILLIPVIPSDGDFAVFWNYGLVVFHLAVYLILSWAYLLRHRLSSSQKVFHWYRNILTGISLVWLFYLGNLLDFNLYYITGPLFYTFLIYAFSYLFLNRHNFDLDKYGSSNLDRKASKELHDQVKALFLEKRLYLDPDISLKKVAEKLSISPRAISQVINQNEQKNFYEFVNQYRIENAMDILTDIGSRSEKIATIAYEVGFGTVTAFNVAFKKKTGETPSEYRRKRLFA